MYGWLTVCMVG